jgi:hypothetical protein
MFDQTDTSAARTKRESAPRSIRDARAVRRADAGGYVSKMATQTSLEELVQESDSRARFAAVIGLSLIIALALSGAEVLARVWASTEMIR